MIQSAFSNLMTEPNILSSRFRCCIFKESYRLTITIRPNSHYFSSKSLLLPIFFRLQNVSNHARKNFGKFYWFSEIFFFSSVKEKISILFKKIRVSMHKLPTNQGTQKIKKSIVFLRKEK